MAANSNTSRGNVGISVSQNGDELKVTYTVRLPPASKVKQVENLRSGELAEILGAKGNDFESAYVGVMKSLRTRNWVNHEWLGEANNKQHPRASDIESINKTLINVIIKALKPELKNILPGPDHRLTTITDFLEFAQEQIHDRLNMDNFSIVDVFPVYLVGQSLDSYLSRVKTFFRRVTAGDGVDLLCYPEMDPSKIGRGLVNPIPDKDPSHVNHSYVSRMIIRLYVFFLLMGLKKFRTIESIRLLNELIKEKLKNNELKSIEDVDQLIRSECTEEDFYDYSDEKSNVNQNQETKANQNQTSNLNQDQNNNIKKSRRRRKNKRGNGQANSQPPAKKAALGPPSNNKPLQSSTEVPQYSLETSENFERQLIEHNQEQNRVALALINMEKREEM